MEFCNFFRLTRWIARLNIRVQQEKSSQKDDLFFLGFEKDKKMQTSVIDSGTGKYSSRRNLRKCVAKKQKPKNHMEMQEN